MTKRNKDLREIYLLAAADIAEQFNWGCCALVSAGNKLQRSSDLAIKLFRFLYEPSPGALLFWRRDTLGPVVCQQNRILALLFMAELARTDSLPTLSEIQTA